MRTNYAKVGDFTITYGGVPGKDEQIIIARTSDDKEILRGSVFTSTLLDMYKMQKETHVPLRMFDKAQLEDARTINVAADTLADEHRRIYPFLFKPECARAIENTNAQLEDGPLNADRYTALGDTGNARILLLYGVEVNANDMDLLGEAVKLIPDIFGGHNLSCLMIAANITYRLDSWEQYGHEISAQLMQKMVNSGFCMCCTNYYRNHRDIYFFYNPDECEDPYFPKQ